MHHKHVLGSLTLAHEARGNEASRNIGFMLCSNIVMIQLTHVGMLKLPRRAVMALEAMAAAEAVVAIRAVAET